MSEYIGLDVSKEETCYCVMDKQGKILARGKAASDPKALFEMLKEHTLCPERIVLETGTLSNWLTGRPAGKEDAGILRLRAARQRRHEAQLEQDRRQ